MSKKKGFGSLSKKEKIAIVGACSASVVASVILRAPGLMGLPLYAIAQNRERIATRLRRTEKVTEHDIKCFFHEVDNAMKRGQVKLKEMM